MVNLTLIIAVYKDVEALEAVFRTLKEQTFRNFEVILAEDGNKGNFEHLVLDYSSDFRITHLQQEDKGFLKNQILNEAIRISKSEKLVFIDGDCILHPKFLLQYNRCIVQGRVCMGRRVDLDAMTTKKVKSGATVIPSVFTMLKNKTVRVEEAFYLPWTPQSLLSRPKLLGCNMGWYKADLLALNGFDESYTEPGYGEDSDIEWRALKFGLNAFSMRFKAIQYHLNHDRPDREDKVSLSRNLFGQRKEEGHIKPKKGLIHH